MNQETKDLLAIIADDVSEVKELKERISSIDNRIITNKNMLKNICDHTDENGKSRISNTLFRTCRICDSWLNENNERI